MAHFIYIFLIKTNFRFAHVFWLLGNIKQPPLTPKLFAACAGVDITLPTMTSHGAYRDTKTVDNLPGKGETRATSSKEDKMIVAPLSQRYYKPRCGEWPRSGRTIYIEHHSFLGIEVLPSSQLSDVSMATSVSRSVFWIRKHGDARKSSGDFGSLLISSIYSIYEIK